METLSVIVPVYNCKGYLKKCIESVIAVNKYGGDIIVNEIILVDDGSTDGSSELCDTIVAENNSKICEIYVIHQKNSGVSAARNMGLRVAKGDFILFVDSDDSVDPQMLAELMQTVSRDPSIDMAVFGMSFDYYSGDRIYRQVIMNPGASGEKSIDECKEMLYSLFSRNALSSLCNRLIRRSIFMDDGLALREDMFLYEDLEFSLRLMARCKKFHFCSEPIYHYRQAADEGNAGRRLKRIEHIPEIVDKIENALVPLGDSNDIILSLYLVLARVKIGCASKEEADVVCSDFKEWVDEHELLENIHDNDYAMLLYNGRITKLLYKRRISKIRHRIAVAVKKTVGDFRKQ